ncbi:MAG: acyl-CoA thioesterase [Phycisphaeraceae bacterium]|nr:acyl-CoA thioesterase [Phycisphaeraceae bacterium]
MRPFPGESAPVPARAVPTSGVMAVRPRYCECDPMGVVHHAAYVPWLEMGRTELLREAGVTYAQLESAGVFLVIVKLECSFKRPARYDDLLEVRTRVIGGSRVKIRHEYEIWCTQRAVGGGGDHAGPELLLTASSMLACVDRSGRPAALPDWLAGA